MDAKKIIIATLAGAVTLFLLGFVFYVVLLNDFFMNAAGSSAGGLPTGTHPLVDIPWRGGDGWIGNPHFCPLGHR